MQRLYQIALCSSNFTLMKSFPFPLFFFFFSSERFYIHKSSAFNCRTAGNTDLWNIFDLTYNYVTNFQKHCSNLSDPTPQWITLYTELTDITLLQQNGCHHHRAPQGGQNAVKENILLSLRRFVQNTVSLQQKFSGCSRVRFPHQRKISLKNIVVRMVSPNLHRLGMGEQSLHLPTQWEKSKTELPQPVESTETSKPLYHKASGCVTKYIPWWLVRGGATIRKKRGIWSV